MGKGCTNCMRVIVIVINVLFLLIGLAIMGLSGFAYFCETTQSIREFMGDSLVIDIPLFAAFGIGFLTVLVSCCGCCGAVYESPCLLAAYLVLLLVIVGVEVAGGAFLYIQNAHDKIESEIVSRVGPKLRGTNATTVPDYIERVQQLLQCCGANGTEYDLATMAAVCRDEATNEKFRQGCASCIRSLFDRHFDFGLIGIGCVAGFELLTVALALAICCCSRKEEEGYVGVNAD